MISRLGGLEIRYKGGIYILKNKVLFSSITSLVVFLSIFCINGRASKGVDVTEARESMVAPEHQTIAASEDTAETITIADESVTEGATDGTPEAETEAEIEEESVPETTTVVKETEPPETTKPEPETTEKPKETTTKAERATAEKGAYIGNFKITGYTAEEGFKYGAQTASYDSHGYTCRPGICAMNSQRRKDLGLKYGDQIYVEGLGTFTVADCGCNYNVVDIWVYTNKEAEEITGHYNVYYA